MCQLDDVGEIILAFGVVLADAGKQVQSPAAVERHQPPVAEADTFLLRRTVLVLADGHEASVRLDQTSVSCGIVGAKAHHDDGSAVGQSAARRGKGLAIDQRRIAEQDQQIIIAAFDRSPCGEYGMRGAEPLRLQEGFAVSANGATAARTSSPPRPTTMARSPLPAAAAARAT